MYMYAHIEPKDFPPNSVLEQKIIDALNAKVFQSHTRKMLKYWPMGTFVGTPATYRTSEAKYRH